MAVSDSITPYLRLQVWNLATEKSTSHTRLNESVRQETVLAPDSKHLARSG